MKKPIVLFLLIISILYFANIIIAKYNKDYKYFLYSWNEYPSYDKLKAKNSGLLIDKKINFVYKGDSSNILDSLDFWLEKRVIVKWFAGLKFLESSDTIQETCYLFIENKSKIKKLQIELHKGDRYSFDGGNNPLYIISNRQTDTFNLRFINYINATHETELLKLNVFW